MAASAGRVIEMLTTMLVWPLIRCCWPAEEVRAAAAPETNCTETVTTRRPVSSMA
jgi:hypothetical protein